MGFWFFCHYLGSFEIVSKKVLWSVRGSYQTKLGPPLPNVTRHSGWWQSTVAPSIDQALHLFLTLLLIWTFLLNLTFYLIARGLHRTFATGAACQQRTLTPPDTWSCPALGLGSVLMLRPISPELVLLPDFSVSNIPRYFCFAWERDIFWNLEPPSPQSGSALVRRKKEITKKIWRSKLEKTWRILATLRLLINSIALNKPNCRIIRFIGG